MKKLSILFTKIFLGFLLFDIVCIQGQKDNKECFENSEGICQKSTDKIINPELDEADVGKSIFSKTHDCKNDGNTDNSNNINEGSCLRKDLEDEDQSELSMLEEQTKKEEDTEACQIGDDKSSKCVESSLEKFESSEHVDDLEEEIVVGSIDEETDAANQSPDELLLDPEEEQKINQDPDIGNVPLREILLKLKPEGLTDNEDDQPSDYSVTEASMGEEEEVEEEVPVSSGSAEKQEYGVDGSSADGSKNGSGSSSSTSINKKAACSELNVTEPVADVEIINATLLMKLLQGNSNVTNRSISAPCHLIYFFSPYCPFSVAGSPYVNALARSLNNIPVYGLDSIEHHSVNARYGVMGTPTLLLFHNGNGVGRYNASAFSVNDLLIFIKHYTDQNITSINVTSADFRATLPSQVAEGRPYALWASWIFLLICAEWLFLTSELCARLTEAILNNWREAEAQNDQD